MAKSAGRTPSEAVATAADRSAKSLTNGRANVAEHDSARRAYELYLARDRADQQPMMLDDDRSL